MTRSESALRRPVAVGASIALALGGIAITAAPASALDLGTATTETQLVDFITTANGTPAADVINLGGTGFTLTANLPTITQPLTITGPGSSTFTLNAGSFDVFNFASGSTTGGISGVTITGAGTTLNTYGIDSHDVALTVDDVAVTYSYGGLQASGGSVTVTNSSFTNNIQFGSDLDSGTALEATFDNIDFSDNHWAGLYADLGGSSSLTVSDSTADRNSGEGFFVDAYDNAAVIFTDSSADNNDTDGFYVDASGNASETSTRTSADGNDGNGYELSAEGHASLTFTASKADLSVDAGITLKVNDSATATFTDSTATNTEDDDGIRVEAHDSAIVSFTDTTSSDNDADGIEANIFDDSVFTMTTSTINGAGADGVELHASGGGTINVDDLAVDDSDDSGLEFEADTSGSITLSHATVTNSHEGVGAQLFAHHTGRIDISTSTISDSDNQGVWISAIDADGIDADGTDSVVTLTGTTIKDNGNDDIDGGGILIDDPNGLTINVVTSTISGNTADWGGGIYSGSASSNEPPVLHLSVVNSTVSGNVGTEVGGVYMDGGNLSEDSTVSILNSTITANTVEGGGPAGVALLGEFTATIRNSIIAGNIDIPGDFGDLDISETLAPDIAFSLIGVPSSVASGAVAAGVGNLTGVDAKLGPLADNGGPTLTHLPQDNSPAVEAGDPAFSGLAADQRGLDRVVNRLDMGAVELQPMLAATGADSAVPLAGGILLVGAGGLLLLARRRRSAH